MTAREPLRGPDPEIEECAQWIAVLAGPLLVLAAVVLVLLVT